MKTFQVNFMINDWVQIRVDAEDEKTAKEKAEKKLDKLYNSKNGIDCVDGNTTYLGCLNESGININ